MRIFSPHIFVHGSLDFFRLHIRLAGRSGNHLGDETAIRAIHSEPSIVLIEMIVSVVDETG